MEHIEITKSVKVEPEGKCPVCFGELAEDSERDVQIDLRQLGIRCWVCGPCGYLIKMRLAGTDKEEDYAHIPPARLTLLRSDEIKRRMQ